MNSDRHCEVKFFYNYINHNQIQGEFNLYHTCDFVLVVSLFIYLFFYFFIYLYVSDIYTGMSNSAYTGLNGGLCK